MSRFVPPRFSIPIGLLSLLGSLALACTQSSTQPALSSFQKAVPVQFSFPTATGDPITSAGLRGRNTILVFITTYDLASQVVARRIGDTIRTFRPRSNAVAVILEAPSYAPLLPAYAAAMNLPYPIAMIDHDSYQGGGSFRGIDHVPTVVLLDRHGRETWRTSGEVTGLELKRALRQALESGSP